MKATKEVNVTVNLELTLEQLNTIWGCVATSKFSDAERYLKTSGLKPVKNAVEFNRLCNDLRNVTTTI